MKSKSFENVAIVYSTDPADFEAKYNARAKDLSESYKIVSQNVTSENGSYLGVITYEVTETTPDCVADEFHAEGLRFLCKHCPHLEDPKDRRIKYCPCIYAELGRTHKDHEACEVFYRELKAGRITPIEDYMR